MPSGIALERGGDEKSGDVERWTQEQLETQGKAKRASQSAAIQA
jgi:hypothetical protein